MLHADIHITCVCNGETEITFEKCVVDTCAQCLSVVLAFSTCWYDSACKSGMKHEIGDFFETFLGKQMTAENGAKSHDSTALPQVLMAED